MADDVKEQLKALQQQLTDVEKELSHEKDAGRSKELLALRQSYRDSLAKALKEQRKNTVDNAKRRDADRDDYAKLREEVLKEAHKDAGDGWKKSADAAAANAREKSVDWKAEVAAGAATGGEAGAIAAAAAAAAKKAKEAAAKAGKAVKNDVNHGADQAVETVKAAKRGAKSAYPWLLAFIALLIHAYDAIGVNGGSFDRSSNFLPVLALYLFFTLFLVFAYFRTGLSTESLSHFGVALLAFCLPYLLRIPFLADSYLSAVLFFTPILALYIAINAEDSPWLNRIGRWWIAAIVVCILIVLLGRLALPDMFASSGVNIGQSLQRTWADIKDSWARIKASIVAGGFFSPSTWKKKLNETFNPYAQLYTGQVEQNKEEPTGVFITKLESLYPISYVNSSQATILGRIEAKTFLPYTIRVTPSCVLERPGNNYEGTPDPNYPADPKSVPIDVNYKLVRDVTCTFPTEAPAGSYNAMLGVSFDYETWAYITETFVDRKRIESYISQGKDVNRELDIPSQATAVYTNGPVQIGVSAADQPIDIDLNAANDRYIQQRFGFTIQNRWTQGKVKTGTVSAVVMVPKPFVLQNCLPTIWSKTEETDEYTNYTFNRENPDIQLDVHHDYRTVTCQLVLPNKEAAQQVLSFGDKTPVTFVVITKYQYALEKRVPVRISN